MSVFSSGFPTAARWDEEKDARETFPDWLAAHVKNISLHPNEFAELQRALEFEGFELRKKCQKSKTH